MSKSFAIRDLLADERPREWLVKALVLNLINGAIVGAVYKEG